MEIKITDNLILTTDSPVSSYGIPALRHVDCDCGDMAPGDAVPACLQGRFLDAYTDEPVVQDNMAGFLCTTIGLDGLIDDDVESLVAIKRWLAQLPGGPKLAALEGLPE